MVSLGNDPDVSRKTAECRPGAAPASLSCHALAKTPTRTGHLTRTSADVCSRDQTRTLENVSCMHQPDQNLQASSVVISCFRTRFSSLVLLW